MSFSLPIAQQYLDLLPGVSSTALKAAICEETAHAIIEQYGRHVRAIVLTGSLARDEATFVRVGQGHALFGDADVLMIFDDREKLPSPRHLASLHRRIESSLGQRDLVSHITLSAVGPRYLRNVKPTIFAYELRANGQVISGEPQILSIMPPFSVTDLPLTDAWRLLANRIVEQLDAVPDLADRGSGFSARAVYQAIKLFLDMATSLLVFARAYAPTYVGRLENLRALAKTAPLSSEWPFPLDSFADTVAACTRWKLLGALPVGETARELWLSAIDNAQRLWCWELARLTGMRHELPRRQLLYRWMELQPLPERIRSWLYAVRRCGWLKSYRYWPRWARLASTASARYCVYAAGTELLFHLPALASAHGSSPGEDLNLSSLRSWLPAVGGGLPVNTEPTSNNLAREVMQNYQQFLVETLA